MTRNIDTLNLTDVLSNDFSPNSATSDVVDVGYDVSFLGITFDIDNLNRPSGSSFDIGAYEFQSDVINLQVSTSNTMELFDDIIEEENQTILHPNPAYSSFKMKSTEYEDVVLQLISLDGRVVQVSPYKMGTSFNVEEHPAGLYFLKVISPNKTETHRLIIR